MDVHPDRVTMRTGRLVVRTPRPGDGDAYATYFSENLDFLQPVSPTFEPSMFDAMAWEMAIPSLQAKLAAREEARFMLWYYDRLLGVANLTRFQGSPAFTCNLGYSLVKSAQGHGLMSEALVAVIRFAFEEWNVHRIQAAYMNRNERSGNVLRRLGFHVEGSARDYLLINGKWEDHILTAKLNTQWKPMP